jgi:hypothetical protein
MTAWPEEASSSRASLQALLQNDGDALEQLAQGTPVHAYLPPDALRVLPGSPRRGCRFR